MDVHVSNADSGIGFARNLFLFGKDRVAVIARRANGQISGVDKNVARALVEACDAPG